ncbi:PEP-utilizing enzyme [Crossiella cryophila]|uniref:Phosphohistidine swiveling domain-containing protein n=1 Tax=Crossiella cryophila TaxID=43355 RepID=A0A7W7CEG9_9PSEU|nr:PEP-utilizing enzyme [Crossiella cryophila]MBB4679678.1 phosphohistidine swiveling domain-containing protein [Crossiella cryophila]
MSTSEPTLPGFTLLTDPDVLEHQSGPDTAWTITNAAEAMPGVLTPLGASFWLPVCEIGLRSAFHDLGVLSAGQVRLPEQVDERISGVFAGRYAANLDVLRRMADLTPGTSGDAMERQLFGTARPGIPRANGLRRLPFVLTKAPTTVARFPRRLAALSRHIHQWWRTAVTTDLDLPGRPEQALVEASRVTAHALRAHMISAMVGPALFDRLRDLTTKAGLPGLELHLLAGDGDLEEARLVEQLRAVAHGRLPLDPVLATYGFHGPGAGEISAHSWREDPTPLHRMIETYRTAPPPVSRTDRSAAEAELFAALPRRSRSGARLVLRLARTFNPLREISKANFLKAVDAARHAARARGRELVRAGVLGDPEEVFQLTVAEIVEQVPADVAATVKSRRAQRRRLRTVRLPERWTGPAQPIPLAVASTEDIRELRGQAGAGGLAEGRARVVLDAGESDLVEPGEVLVCATTDPSWAPALGIAGAVVIDVGSPMSHGAIIARELGVPCVIGTGTGTVVLRSGDWLRVDGAAGIVTVRHRATTEPEPATAEPNAAAAAQPSSATAGPPHTAAQPSSPSPSAYTSEPTPAPAIPGNNPLLADLPLLRLLMLKGRCPATDLPHLIPNAETSLPRILTQGWALQRSGALRLTAAGRQHTAALLTEERTHLASPLLPQLYHCFSALNDNLKSIMTTWQSGDTSALPQLLDLHDQALPLAQTIAAEAPRLSCYAPRLSHAADKLRAGDLDWLAKPTIDSYHTVWFELHDDLMSLLGLTRLAEAKAGRA